MITAVHYRALENYQTRLLDFGITDNRGRRIGAKISTGEKVVRSFKELPKDWHRIDRPAGRYYVCFIQVQRDNVDYGAGQDWRWFRNTALRDDWIRNHIADMKKRNRAKFGV